MASVWWSSVQLTTWLLVALDFHIKIYTSTYTWQSPDGRTRNQIDHVLISRRLHNTLLDVRSLRGADVYSDHNLVVSKVRLRPAALNNRCIGRRKLNLAKLKNPESLKEYRRYLSTNLENIGVEYTWNDVATACTSAAKSSLGFVKQQNKPWLRESTWQIVQKRRDIKNQLQSTHDPIRKVNLASRYKIADTEVKDKAAKDKERYYNEIASAAEKAAYKNDLKGVYVAINKLANVKPHIPPLKDIDGNTLTTVEEQLTEWRRHYETRESVEEADAVPSNRRRNPNRDISTEPPSSTEIKTAIHKLKNNKAAGSDGIPPELLKFGADEITPLLRPLLLQIWSTNTIPIDWKEGIIISIPKKGDLSRCANWRGITLLNAVIKILAFVILERIAPVLNNILRTEQNGFRPKRSCVDHINTLRIIIEQSAEWRSPLYLLFVDFERAFDTLNRRAIWSSLRTNGVPEKIVTIIQELYEGAVCSVLFKGKKSDLFSIHNGVRQGCVLSPLLFITVLDDIIRKTNIDIPSGIHWRPYQKLCDLDYADDICFLTHKLSEAHAKLTALIRYASQVGLRVNFKKTKLIRIETPNQDALTLEVGGTLVTIEDIENFCYLGSIVSKNGGAEADVSSRINKARHAFHRMNRIWSSRHISTKTKLRIFNTSIKPVLLYACETWKVTDTICNSLQTFINRCLRIIHRIFWPRVITNENLLNISMCKPIAADIKERKWRWIGHTLRKEDNDIAKMALEWNPQGSRRRGRPRTTWMRSTHAEYQSRCSWHEIRKIAQDRSRWSEFVSALCSD